MENSSQAANDHFIKIKQSYVVELSPLLRIAIHRKHILSSLCCKCKLTRYEAKAPQDCLAVSQSQRNGSTRGVLDYEVPNLAKSLILDARGGTFLSIHQTPRAQISIDVGLNPQRRVINMLYIMFGMRIDSAQDPLVTGVMEIGMEYEEVTILAHIYRIYSRKVLIALRTGVWSNAVDFKTKSESEAGADKVVQVCPRRLLSILPFTPSHQTTSGMVTVLIETAAHYTMEVVQRP